MPLKRRLIDVGNSRAVCLPADWLKYFEDKQGHKVKNVLLEVGTAITITIDDSNDGNSDEGSESVDLLKK